MGSRYGISQPHGPAGANAALFTSRKSPTSSVRSIDSDGIRNGCTINVRMNSAIISTTSSDRVISRNPGNSTIFERPIVTWPNASRENVDLAPSPVGSAGVCALVPRGVVIPPPSPAAAFRSPAAPRPAPHACAYFPRPQPAPQRQSAPEQKTVCSDPALSLLSCDIPAAPVCAPATAPAAPT